jgi:ATP-binding cassette subfamily C protein
MKELWSLRRRVLDLLPSPARRFLRGYSAALAALSILDGAALALLAAVITPIVARGTLTLPVVGRIEGAGLLVAVGVVCALIVLKGVLAVVLLRVATQRFAGYELDLGSRLFETFLRSPWVTRLSRNSADLVRLTDASVATTISGFLLPGSTLASELLSFLTLLAVLAIAQPAVAGISLVYLGAIGAVLYLWIGRRSREAGRVALRFSLKSSRLITEMIGALKEVTLRGRTDEAAAVVRSNRSRSTRARANAAFLGQVPRYVLESGIIGGFVIVGVVGYLTGGIVGVTTSVALFGLAGFRMAPSIVRFQGVVNQLNVSAPHAQAILNEIELSERTTRPRVGGGEATLPAEPAAIRVRDASFRYTPDAPDVLHEVNLSIPFGSTVAFVGPSGAGKSTMIDLLLGLLDPTSGAVTIDDVPLADLTAAWRSRVAYVPQDVSLFDSTVARNVALTWTDDYDPDRVRSALARAQLLETVEARPAGIEAEIGERGLSLSGGQRQRLGIARALYADPLVLALDEATSSLDVTTEAAVTEAIRDLRGSMTIITVAHRLATVQSADTIFFLSGGRLVDSGTFTELVARVPEFARQADLAGLGDPPPPVP